MRPKQPGDGQSHRDSWQNDRNLHEIAAAAFRFAPRHPCPTVIVEAIARLGYENSGKNFRIIGEVHRMSVDTTSGNPSMDYREHERTYAGFVFMTKVLVSAAVLLLIGMALFLL